MPADQNRPGARTAHAAHDAPDLCCPDFRPLRGPLTRILSFVSRRPGPHNSLGTDRARRYCSDIRAALSAPARKRCLRRAPGWSAVVGPATYKRTIFNVQVLEYASESHAFAPFAVIC